MLIGARPKADMRFDLGAYNPKKRIDSGLVWEDGYSVLTDGVNERLNIGTVNVSTNSHLKFTAGNDMTISMSVYIPNQGGGSFKGLFNHFSHNNEGVGARDVGWKTYYLVSGGGANVNFYFTWTPISTQVATITSNTLSTDTWHRLTFSIPGTGNSADFNLYANGSNQTSSRSGTVGTATTARGTAPMTWGGEYDANTASYILHGNFYMRDVVIHSEALNSTQVSTDYNSGTPVDARTLGFSNIVGYWPVVSSDDLTSGTGFVTDFTDNKVNFVPTNTEASDLTTLSP